MRQFLRSGPKACEVRSRRMLAWRLLHFEHPIGLRTDRFVTFVVRVMEETRGFHATDLSARGTAARPPSCARVLLQSTYTNSFKLISTWQKSARASSRASGRLWPLYDAVCRSKNATASDSSSSLGRR